VKTYGKFIAQVLATVVAAIVAALADNRLDTPEWINVVIVGLGAVAVLGAGNLPSGVWSHTKTIVAAATAGAVFLQSAISDGITGAEWLQLLLAVVGALGVFAAPGPKVALIGRHEAI
jgi:drug/metabolite transporter (DMT)-like permease